MPDQALETIRCALALREAVQAARSWEDVAPALARRGLDLGMIRRSLAPRIGFDPHSHTIHSDGILTGEQLAWWCRAVGLRAIGITDHDNITPAIGDAIDAAAAMGVRLVPGLEFTIERLGGQAWKGLEVGLHFFPAERFAAFIRSDKGRAFCERFAPRARAKSEQAWQALDAINERFMQARGLQPMARDEVWEASGRTDPVCLGTITVVMLERFFSEGRTDLLAEFPDTRAIMTFIGKSGFAPPVLLPPQGLDDLIDLKETLRRGGIRTTVTLNHPEEWLTKCGLVRADGAPDAPAVRRLVALLTLFDPNRLPIRFIELYSSRNTPASRAFFAGMLAEFEQIRARCFPNLSPLIPMAATDSHRVSGFLDAEGSVRGWVPGEDFLFGMGMVSPEFPTGNLDVPPDYPDAESLLERMKSCAS